MNAPTRADLLTLVSKRFPKQDPIAIVLRWVEELTEESDERLTILDAAFPESIEIEHDARRELFLSAFAHFIKPAKTLPSALRARRASDIKALQISFATSSVGLLTV